MTQVAIFDTEAEAQTAQDAMFISHMAIHDDNNGYRDQTTAWAIPRERLDGKWSVPPCPDHDNSGYTLIDYNPDDYPQPPED